MIPDAKALVWDDWMITVGGQDDQNVVESVIPGHSDLGCDLCGAGVYTGRLALPTRDSGQSLQRVLGVYRRYRELRVRAAEGGRQIWRRLSRFCHFFAAQPECRRSRRTPCTRRLLFVSGLPWRQVPDKMQYFSGRSQNGRERS